MNSFSVRLNEQMLKVLAFEAILFTLSRIKLPLKLSLKLIPVDTGRKLNVHKTFRRHSGRILNALCTFNLRPVSTG